MIVSAYSNTFTSPPYLDDFHSFIYEKALYLHDISVSGIQAVWQTKFGGTRFLPMVTFALNHYLWESSLFHFHAVNLLIHLLAFVAVLWLIRLILAAGKDKGNEGPLFELAGFFPLCVAAIWALSPLQTNAVTYLVQRMASMQTLFFTLSAACFIKARLLSGTKTRRSALFFSLCALSALCSFFSKENSLVLPFALVLTDIWFFDSAWMKKFRAGCRKTGWKIRTAAVAALFLFSYYAWTAVLPKVLRSYAQRDFNLVERLLTEGRVVVWYMSLLIWPAPSRLSMEHIPQISTSLLSPFTTLPALLLIALFIFLAIRLRRRLPIITFGVVWFFLNLAIESTIIPLELVFEHRLYLPSIGFYLSAAAVVTLLFRHAARRLPQTEFSKAACSALLIAAACLALLTLMRNNAWEDKLTIRYDTVTKAPGSPRAKADYANTLCEAGRYEETIEYAEKAIEIGKKGREADGLAMNALTIALINQGKFDEALKRNEEFFKNKATGKSQEILPFLSLNLAQGCITEKKPELAYKWTLNALKYIQKTDNSDYKKDEVELHLMTILDKFGSKELDLNHDGVPDPGDLPPALRVAREFKKHHEAQRARQIIEREYAKAPDDPHLKAEIEAIQKADARTRAQQEKFNFARKYLQDPFSKFNFNFDLAFLVQEKQLPRFFWGWAERRLDAALEIDPDSRDARLLKAWYYYNRDDAQNAVDAARKVLASDPEDSNTWLALGFFLARAGDSKAALAAFEKVIELFPDYPKRPIIDELCKQLRLGEPTRSASNMN
jgi:tetratricopeptide (TPR) repeat protein